MRFDLKNGSSVQALKDVSLDIDEGQIITVLGPSGCGKTTLLNIVAGFLAPTEGKVILNDEIVLGPGAERGMVFQQGALFEWMNVRSNVAFGPRMKGMSKSEQEEKVKHLLEIVGLADFEDKAVYELSGGMQQRVALARCLANDPDVILMDEPLGALDKQLREKMQFEITRLAHNLGITVVYVTHDQTEALTMSDRVAVFNDGVIQQIDAPDVLYEQPKNSFVAQFIGENNTLEGVLEDIKDGVALVKLDNGDVIDAKPVNVSAKGDRTRVSIRPERVEFRKDRLKEGAHLLNAEVLEVIYMGDILRTRLNVAGNTEFIVKTRNAPDQTRLNVGEVIEIGWQPEDCRALDA